MSNEEVIERLLKNDKTVVSEISRLIGSVVSRWNWPGNLDYQDVSQKIFSELIEGLRSGKLQLKAKLTTYIYALARNIAIDEYRMARAAELAEIDLTAIEDPTPSVEEKALNIQRRKTAVRVLLSLPSECRKLWRTVFWGKRNYAQAAEVLGLTEGTVKRKMWECRQQAQKILEKLKK